MADEKPETAEGAAKRRKINALTAVEIDAALTEAQAKQGGLHSRYARQLLMRKKVLAGK